MTLLIINRHSCIVQRQLNQLSIEWSADCHFHFSRIWWEIDWIAECGDHFHLGRKKDWLIDGQAEKNMFYIDMAVYNLIKSWITIVNAQKRHHIPNESNRIHLAVRTSVRLHERQIFIMWISFQVNQPFVWWRIFCSFARRLFFSGLAQNNNFILITSKCCDLSLPSIHK